MKLSFQRAAILIFLLPVLAISCSTPLQELIYLNGLQPGSTYVSGPLPERYQVKPNDQLFIQVISDNPADAAFLNLMGSMGTLGSIGSTSGSYELITYLVDEEGKISYPQLGELKVENLTLGEVRSLVQEGVDTYLEGASVFVKLVNRTITVLGEVKSPGQKPMVKNQLTIFEAIGSAGDVSDYGDRQTVKLIRELPEGKYVGELDLTDPQIIYSPYYYVLPHDVIYVEPKTRVYGAKNLDYTAPLSITASVISLGLLILNLFK